MAELDRLGRIGGRVDDDGVVLSFENILKIFPQLLTQLVVQINERFVQQQYLGALDECPGQGDALLLTARQGRRTTFFKIGKPDLAQYFPCPLMGFGPRHPGSSQRKSHVRQHV